MYSALFFYSVFQCVVRILLCFMLFFASSFIVPTTLFRRLVSSQHSRYSLVSFSTTIHL